MNFGSLAKLATKDRASVCRIVATCCLALATTAPLAATMAKLRQVFDDPALSDAQVIQLAAKEFNLPAVQIAAEVGYTGNLSVEQPLPARSRGGAFAERTSEKAVGGVVLGGVFGLLFALLALLRKYGPRLLAAAKNGVGANTVAPASEQGLGAVHQDSRAHDAYYVQALAELDEAREDKATWARAVASSNGDDGRAKSNYIKLRVAQLESKAA